MPFLWRLSPAGLRRDLDHAACDLDHAEFQVVRFEQVPGLHARELLGLSVRMPFELPSRARPTLLVERDSVELVYTPRLTSRARVPANDSGDWLWRGVFPVPPELSSDPRSLFALRLYDHFRVALPQPVSALRPQESPERRSSEVVWPYAKRSFVLLLVVTCQLFLVAGLASPGALAAETPGSAMTVEPAPEKQSGQPAGPTPETPPGSAAVGAGQPAQGQASKPPAHTQHQSTKTGAEANVVELSVSEEASTPAAGNATPPVRHQGHPTGGSSAGGSAAGVGGAGRSPPLKLSNGASWPW